DLSPKRWLRSGEARRVACPRAERRTGRCGAREVVGQEGRDRLRQVAGERELAVVLRGVDPHRVCPEYTFPEVRDLARGAVTVVRRRDVHDRAGEQVAPGGGEAVRMGARERVTARKAAPEPQFVRPGDDCPLYRPDIG